MKRSQINPMPQYYDYYINLVADVELSAAFDESIKQLNELDRDLLSRLAEQTYAPGKWTVKDILQHVIDWERILSYRSMLIARGVESGAQDIDQNLLTQHSFANARTINSQTDELKMLRLTTKALFESFDERALLKKGTSWKYQTSVLAMGFMMLGHQIHHFKVIEEKYFPLLQSHC